MEQPIQKWSYRHNDLNQLGLGDNAPRYQAISSGFEVGSTQKSIGNNFR